MRRVFLFSGISIIFISLAYAVGMWSYDEIQSARRNFQIGQRSLESGLSPKDSTLFFQRLQRDFPDFKRNARRCDEATEVWYYFGSPHALRARDILRLREDCLSHFDTDKAFWLDLYPSSDRHNGEVYSGFTGRLIFPEEWDEAEPILPEILSPLEAHLLDTDDESFFDRDEEAIRVINANRLSFYYIAFAHSPKSSRLYAEKFTIELEQSSNHQLLEFLRWRGVIREEDPLKRDTRIECNRDSLRQFPKESLVFLAKRFSRPTLEDELQFQPRNYLQIRRLLSKSIELVQLEAALAGE